MRNESVINGKLGRLHDLQGSIPDALLCYEKELEIATELGDHEREIKSATNIGIIRAGYLEYDTALEHFDLALDRALQHSTWHAYQARAHGNVGNMLAKRLKFQKALENHKKDLRITLQHIPEDKIGTSVAYSNVGSCLCVLGRHEESLEFHFKDLKLLEEFLELSDDDFDLERLNNLLVKCPWIVRDVLRENESLTTSYKDYLIVFNTNNVVKVKRRNGEIIVGFWETKMTDREIGRAHV